MSRVSSRNGTPVKIAPLGSSWVNVFVRLRDATPEESVADLCVQMSASSCEVHVPGRGRFPFTFDGCLWSHSASAGKKQLAHCDQGSLYESVGRPVLDNAIAGFNACILSYGATGSGKTYSMFGGPRNDDKGSSLGIVPRLCNDVFKHLSRLPCEASAHVTVSMVEIYLEDVFDLLSQRRELRVRGEGGTFLVVGAKQISVGSYAEVVELLTQAEKCKTVASTAIHERSSRAHTIFQLELTFTRPDGSIKTSKIALADLAGSERIKEARTDGGIALNQACNINLSLMTLGTCIEAVVSRPKSSSNTIGEFRNSTLTKVLKEFIGGNSVTTMLINIAPTIGDANNTIQTLRFADRAKRLHNNVQRNTWTKGSSSFTSTKQNRDPDVEKRREELHRRRELLAQEFECEEALQAAQDQVFQAEACYSASTDCLEIPFRALEVAMVHRDSCEEQLDSVRRQAYPREYALRDELENVRVSFETLRDSQDMNAALAQVRIHELEASLKAAQRNQVEQMEIGSESVSFLENQIAELKSQVDEADVELSRLRRRSSTYEEDMFALRNELDSRVEQLEAEKSQLSLHYGLLLQQQSSQYVKLEEQNATLESDSKLLVDRATKVHQEELRRQVARVASSRSALEMERSSIAAVTQHWNRIFAETLERCNWVLEVNKLRQDWMLRSVTLLHEENWTKMQEEMKTFQLDAVDRHRAELERMQWSTNQRHRTDLETVLQQCMIAQSAMMCATSMVQQQAAGGLPTLGSPVLHVRHQTPSRGATSHRKPLSACSPNMYSLSPENVPSE